MQDRDAGNRPVGPRTAIPESPAPEGPGTTGADQGTGGRFANRPPGYPNALLWLRAGILRDWRGALGAFIAAWFYLPIALWFAVLGAIVLGAVGLYAGGAGPDDVLPPELLDIPLVGTLIDAFVVRAGGVLGGLLGFGIGFLAGFLLVVIWPWQASFDELPTLVTGLAGVVAAAVLVGLLYTLYRVLLEPWLLTVSGARQPSRREAAALTPVLHDCARRLGLPAVPRLLVEDDLVLTNARAYSRHIVVTTSLLSEPPQEIAALLSHELVHWRTGDEVTSAFVRGVALPLFLVHAVPTWLMRTFPHPATNFLMFVIFWPVLLTMKYLVMPFHARDIRAAEYRADLGAVITGNLAGMRSILERRKSFETGRSGWDEAVCATHPANELRLDRLEQAELALPAADVVPDAAARSARPPTAEAIFGEPGAFGSRRSWLIGGAVLLACCLVSGLLGIVQWGFFRPEAAVDGYFSALADHDGEAALDRLSPEAREAVPGDQFLAKLVAAKDYQPPTDVKVTSVERDKDTATATVSFKLAGADHEATLDLQRDTSASLGLFHGWHITNGLASFSIVGGQAPIVVNGVQLPAGTEDYSLAALPGGYVVAGSRNALSETSRQTVVAGLDPKSPTPIDVTPTIRPDAQTRADAVIKKYLDDCAAQKVAAPIGCPFSRYGTVQQITWKIIEYPKVRIELTSPGTAQVSTSYEDQGTARATGREPGYLSGSIPFDDEDQFSVAGTLGIDGEELTFHPQTD